MIGPTAAGPQGFLGPRGLVALLVVLVVVIAPFLLFGERFEQWTRLALAGASPRGASSALLCIALLAGDVLLPVPSSLVSLACGLAWGPWVGTLVSAAGMTLGSGLGYALGRWAGADQARSRMGSALDLIERHYRRHGDAIVILLRPVPVLAEASAIFAGLTRMSLGRYLALSLAANSAVSACHAATGALLGHAPLAGVAVLIAILGATAVSFRRARGSA